MHLLLSLMHQVKVPFPVAVVVQEVAVVAEAAEDADAGTGVCTSSCFGLGCLFLSERWRQVPCRAVIRLQNGLFDLYFLCRTHISPFWRVL